MLVLESLLILVFGVSWFDRGLELAAVAKGDAATGEDGSTPRAGVVTRGVTLTEGLARSVTLAK